MSAEDLQLLPGPDPVESLLSSTAATRLGGCCAPTVYIQLTDVFSRVKQVRPSSVQDTIGLPGGESSGIL